MSDNTTIEWVDATWNPVTGCTRVSPGCDHCYALTFAERFRNVPGHYYERGFDVQLRDRQLLLPTTWQRPRRVFTNSMSDLFHVEVPDAFIGDVFDVMAACPQHLFHVLTKRATRMRHWVSRNRPAPLPNVLLGVSVESTAYHWRVDQLRDTPAARRYLSCEPLLGPLDGLNLSGIHWVIAGGESGQGARPLQVTWIRDLINRCHAAGTPIFVKQLGRSPLWRPEDAPRRRLQHPKGGDIAEWPADLVVRQLPDH